MPLQKLPEDTPEDEVDEVWFYAALDKRYHRLAVFIADDNGQILYKTDQLEANYCYPGELRQPIEKLASVSFQDVDNDSDTDIILIAQCHMTEEIIRRILIKWEMFCSRRMAAFTETIGSRTRSTALI